MQVITHLLLNIAFIGELYEGFIHHNSSSACVRLVNVSVMKTNRVHIYAGLF